MCVCVFVGASDKIMEAQMMKRDSDELEPFASAARVSAQLFGVFSEMWLYTASKIW